MKSVIQLVILILALAGGAFAQFEPGEPTSSEIYSFSGVQSSPGKYVLPLQQVTGNSFVLNGSSRSYSSLLLTISFDYAGEADPVNGNNIVGGSWNLSVYANGDYVGSVFGEVREGRISWYGPSGGKQRFFGATRGTSAVLAVTGGTGNFEGQPLREDIYYKSSTNLDNEATETTVEHLNL